MQKRVVGYIAVGIAVLVTIPIVYPWHRQEIKGDIVKIAIEKKQPELCENIRTDTFMGASASAKRDACYYAVAVALNDVTICEKAKSWQPLCFGKFAFDRQDFSICDQISDGFYRNGCLMDVVNAFLPGKTFSSRATSGMWGVFGADGKILVYSGHEFDPKHPNQSSDKQVASWLFSDNALLMKFSEETTLDWPFTSMKFIEKNGQKILSFDEGCVNIVGDSTVKEGQIPKDLDQIVKPGSCD